MPYKQTAINLVHLQQHFLRMGYVVVHREDNPWYVECTELTLIRARCPNTGVYATESLGAGATGNGGKDMYLRI